jgi:hypothetical protein
MLMCHLPRHLHNGHRKRCAVVQAGHSPYRESKLTMLLKEMLSTSSHRSRVTCVVATVSPCSGDAEHTLNTLKIACSMAGADVEPAQHSGFGMSEVLVRCSHQAGLCCSAQPVGFKPFYAMRLV